jgi:hypothetical protein
MRHGVVASSLAVTLLVSFELGGADDSSAIRVDVSGIGNSMEQPDRVGARREATAQDVHIDRCALIAECRTRRFHRRGSRCRLGGHRGPHGNDARCRSRLLTARENYFDKRAGRGESDRPGE